MDDDMLPEVTCIKHAALQCYSVWTKSCFDKQPELFTTVNNEICKCMFDFTESRKLTEAKTDTFDDFFTRLAVKGREKGRPYFNGVYEAVGSRGEGMGFLANDTDILCTLQTTLACFPSPDIDLLDSMLVIETDDCHQGYCRLKFHRENLCDTYSISKKFFVKKKRSVYLCNNALVNLFQEGNMMFETWQPHGPALTSEELQQDWVITIRCVNPGRLLLKYVNRKRLWPDSETLERLKNVQYGVVNASHPTCKEPSLEFRISFASAEKLLIRSFSNIQFAVFAYLKYIKRHVEDSVCRSDDVLRTYYVKMAILWCSEWVDPTEWTASNFLRCTSMCLVFLQQSFLSRYLPQLFIPENNLIDHLDPDECDRIASCLGEYIDAENPKMFLSCLCDETFDEAFDKILARPRRNLPYLTKKLFLQTSTSNIALHSISSIMETDTLSYIPAELKVYDVHVFCPVLYETLQDLETIVPPDMVDCMRSMLYRFLGDIVHREPGFIRSNTNQAGELYTRGKTLVYPISKFNDEEFSGNVQLALFRYLNREYTKAWAILRRIEKRLFTVNIVNILSIILVYGDLPRLWHDTFLTGMVSRFGDPNLDSLPIKCNALGLYILVQCIRKLYKDTGLCSQRLRKINRSISSNIKHLSVFDPQTRQFTSMVLHRTRSVSLELLSRLEVQ
ncbi:uncharacterized protein [Argopecten irradians]|uniref:uncharacterized protein n=1 Tax=Argopecten irradians TaxID=31199 RepID=UPI00371991A7